MKHKETLVFVGLLLSIFGMLFFNDQQWLKYLFLIGGIVIILIGIGIKKK